jgi:hypothetical protein
MDLSGPGIDVKLKEKKERKKSFSGSCFNSKTAENQITSSDI